MPTFHILSNTSLAIFTTTLRSGLAFIALVGAIPIAAAQEDLSDVETITISALRREIPITEVGSSLSIITSEDIDNLGLDFVFDALTLSPGVTINQNGPFGGLASVRIRGAATGQTLVLLDGIPVNDPSSASGGFNFANLDTSIVERIEILRGPQSTLWGTDAIGGVISIVTKSPEEGFDASAFAEIGSFDTFRGGASASYGSDLGDARLGISGITTNGISKADEANGNTEEDGFDNLTVNFKGGLNLPADARLNASFFYNDATSEFDSFSFGAQGSVADGDEESNSEELTGNVSLNLPVFDGRLQNLLQVGYSQIERTNFRDGAESFSSEGDRILLRYQGNFDIADGYSLLFGAERDKTDANGDEASINGFFGILEAQPLEGLTLSGGVRHDDHSDFGSETTFRAAIAYNPVDWLTLRGSWGEGFKAPTIFQLTFDCTFCPLSTGPNTDLLPEESEAFDVGLTLRAPDGRGSFTMTYFNQDSTNQIDFDNDFGYINTAIVDSSGVEISADYQVIDWLTVSGDYTLINAEDGDGDNLIRIPKHTANMQFQVSPTGPFSGSILVRYNGEEPDRNGAVLDNWIRVDLAAQYEVADNFELFGRIENLTDTQYQQILGYGTPGISFYFGARIGL